MFSSRSLLSVTKDSHFLSTFYSSCSNIHFRLLFKDKVTSRKRTFRLFSLVTSCRASATRLTMSFYVVAASGTSVPNQNKPVLWLSEIHSTNMSSDTTM